VLGGAVQIGVGPLGDPPSRCIRVFGIDLDNLLGPPQLAMHERAVQLIDDVRTSYRAIRAADDQLAADNRPLRPTSTPTPRSRTRSAKPSAKSSRRNRSPRAPSPAPLVHFGHPPNVDDDDGGPTDPPGE